MSKILGYGEDSFTLWFLKNHLSRILDEFQDQTASSDCLIFYRPSFGRHSKENSSVFGEFDAVVASKENIYLIESKWDNFGGFHNDELILREEQTLRHKIFSWYLTHWNKKYSNDWQAFINENQKDFKFKNKTIAPKHGEKQSLLATNLEFILHKLLEHCRSFSSESNIKNVLLFFFNGKKSEKPTKINGFALIPIDYSKAIQGNFVTLYDNSDKGLRDSLVKIALEWEKRFAVLPRITDAIAEFDAAKLVGTSIRIDEGREKEDTAVKKGSDFRKGNTLYQVKANRPSGKPGSEVTLVSKAKNFNWHKLIWILYDSKYCIIEAYEFTREQYKKLFATKKRLSPNDMRKGKRISDLN